MSSYDSGEPDIDPTRAVGEARTMVGGQMFVDWVAEFVVGGRVLGLSVVDGLLDADELCAVELLCDVEVLEMAELVSERSLVDNEVVLEIAELIPE